MQKKLSRHPTNLEFFQWTQTLAKQSPCQKAGFGSILYQIQRKEIIASEWNRPISPLKHVCPPGECIRLTIPSRTQPMQGACAHSEELAIRYAHWRGKSVSELSRCVMFISGWNPTTQTVIQADGDYSCIRCSITMYHAGIRAIFLWTGTHFRKHEPFTAVQQAYQFLIGNKKASNVHGKTT